MFARARAATNDEVGEEHNESDKLWAYFITSGISVYFRADATCPIFFRRETLTDLDSFSAAAHHRSLFLNITRREILFLLKILLSQPSLNHCGMHITDFAVTFTLYPADFAYSKNLTITNLTAFLSAIKRNVDDRRVKRVLQKEVQVLSEVSSSRFDAELACRKNVPCAITMIGSKGRVCARQEARNAGDFPRKRKREKGKRGASRVYPVIKQVATVTSTDWVDVWSDWRHLRAGSRTGVWQKRSITTASAVQSSRGWICPPRDPCERGERERARAPRSGEDLLLQTRSKLSRFCPRANGACFSFRSLAALSTPSRLGGFVSAQRKAAREWRQEKRGMHAQENRGVAFLAAIFCNLISLSRRYLLPSQVSPVLFHRTSQLLTGAVCLIV